MGSTEISNHIWAGAFAGLLGLLVFLIVHQMTIAPIWFIFPVGSILAVAGGAAVGWAYELLLPRLPQGILISSLVLAGLLTLTQLPGLLIGQVREPILDMSTANILPGRGWEAAGRFVFDLFLPAGIVGALLGWWVGRSTQAALAMALAAVAFSIGPGHNIPFFAGTSGVVKMSVIMLVVILASALSLAGALAWLNNR